MSITTKLVNDGNSVIVHIPKMALAMSGLRDEVVMEVKKGQIVLTLSVYPRSQWRARIAKVIASNPDALAPDPELIV